jgi:CheY-like chemotaxis protein
VLDLSKIEAGKLCLEQLPARFEELFDDVLRSLRLQSQAKGLVFELKRSQTLPATLITDSVRFRQILWNLTSNAMKFTSQGSIRVSIDARRDTETENYVLSFRIQDSGIGISEEHKESIFQAFVQADSSMNRKFGGSGLGLVLSRRLAEAMGGSLVLDWSRCGVGSSFTFSLVVPSCAWNVPIRKERELPSEPLQELEKPPTLLLVDDATDNLLLMSFLLDAQGAKTSQAQSAKEALDILEQQTFDLILTDIQMPHMDGYEFVKQLRLQGIKTPVIAMTAHALSEEQERCLAAGCNGYLSKPIQSQKLWATVVQWTQSQSSLNS